MSLEWSLGLVQDIFRGPNTYQLHLIAVTYDPWRPRSFHTYSNNNILAEDRKDDDSDHGPEWTFHLNWTEFKPYEFVCSCERLVYWLEDIMDEYDNDQILSMRDVMDWIRILPDIQQIPHVSLRAPL
ncbi:hypothetical protein OBBRIDRAFT_836673 [Obba rivulosa]|uniref:Uncharacterized protein n=1 Tax=Obba rivulosa TaxID=1052685 RepID=A0A8E2DIS1_9APHY|nr:hypothetical protein OBBRIDRAFT_836673 [Obba rivulosa]